MSQHELPDRDLVLSTIRAAVAHDDARDQSLDALLLRGCPGRADEPIPAIDHERVRDADPLALDGLMSRLPALNAAGDVEPLVTALRTAAAGRTIDTAEDAAAAVRDAGMLAASLQRHGVDPATAVPELAAALTAWASLSGTIPRDTVVHYGWWNPVGERERHFTDDARQESVLIDSVRQACRLLPAAAVGLDYARHAGVSTEDGLQVLDAAAQAVHAFAAGFESVRRGVSPEYFARELRPYFDPITIEGVSYCGPAAAFVPLYLVDEVLWGTGTQHAQLHEEALQYGRSLWRVRRAQLARHEPLNALVARRLESGAIDDGLRQAAESLSTATRSLLRFRGQHATLAKRAYLSQLTDYATGSGGYAPTMLLSITTTNRDAATEFDHVRLTAGAPAEELS